MIVKKLRLQRGWSQDQLAEMADVSVRTIQRAERGHKLSLDTANAFASVFEVDITTFNYTDTFKEDQTMNTPTNQTVQIEKDEEQALSKAKSVKDFAEEIVTFLIIFAVFAVTLGITKPVMYLVFLGVGLCLVVQGLFVFEIVRLPTTSLERWIAEKLLGRKL